MKVKLHEARWEHSIDGELALDFRSAIRDANLEGVKGSSIALLDKCKEFFDPEDQDYVIYEIEDLIDSFGDVIEDEDEIDMLLDELYDFCDGYSIFIDTEEYAEPEEVSIDELGSPVESEEEVVISDEEK